VLDRFRPAKGLLVLLTLALVAPVLAACEGYTNRCDTAATSELRAQCRNSLIQYDQQLRGNRSYRVL